MSDTQLPTPYAVHHTHDGDVDYYTADQMRAYASEAVRAALAAQGEPVCYAHINANGKVRAVLSEPRGAIKTPLYAAPPAPASAEREARVIEQNARKAAQEQLYAERERHTAEVKRLQAEIGRLKAPAASVSDEREAFEAEMRCEEVWGHRSLVKRPDGRYQNWQVNAMWDVWQARAALRPAQAGDRLDAVMPHIHDLYAELGIRWGDNPFPVIGRLRAAQAGVPDDIVKDAERYRWLRRKACVIGKTTYCGEETGQPILDFVNLPDVTEVISRDSATTLDAAIDAAMLAAAPTKEGGAE